MYELSVLPKYLFTPDGNLHKCTDTTNGAREFCNLQACVMLDLAVLNREPNEESKIIILMV